jgi:Uma2 family endonuclease
MSVATLSRPPKALLTYETYRTTPLSGNYEIIDGELQKMAGATWIHQECVGKMYELLRVFQRRERSGRALFAPFDILIQEDPLRTRQPDVLFISHERLAELGGIPEEGPLPGGPELVVEVLSPSDTPRTLNGKLTDFAQVGVLEAWLVSPESETIQVQRLRPSNIEFVGVFAYGQTVTSQAFPAFSLSLADLFDD